MKKQILASLGKPDLVISGLHLWIHKRQFTESIDYWDSNWLFVTAHCIYPESIISVSGPIIHTSEIISFLHECELMYANEKLTARLNCMEENINIELIADNRGHIAAEISITPNVISESHKYIDNLDQTYLPSIISSCRKIVCKWKLVGSIPQ